MSDQNTGGVWDLSSLVNPSPPPQDPPAQVPLVQATPWAPPPPPASPPPDAGPAPATRHSPGRNNRMIGIAVVAVLALAAIGGVFAVQLGGSGSPALQGTGGTGANAGGPATDAAGFPVPEEATAWQPTEEGTTYPTADPTISTDPEAEALAALEQQWSEDAGSIAFSGQYAAQIASKYPGIADPLQTAADGSHTFGAADILAEHQRLRADHGSAEHPVLLLKSTDYGKRQLKDGNFLWVTVATGDFADKDAVNAWCGNQFGSLTADELANQCAARQLRPAS